MRIFPRYQRLDRFAEIPRVIVHPANRMNKHFLFTAYDYPVPGKDNVGKMQKSKKVYSLARDDAAMAVWLT